MEWSKPEKVIAHRVFYASYERECMAIAQEVRKMTEKINGPSDCGRFMITYQRKEMKQNKSTITVIQSCCPSLPD